jgi:hypothetical protein
MHFRQRDELVMAIHDALDLLLRTTSPAAHAERPDPMECKGCGSSQALCLEYKLNEAVACCPDCTHERAETGT